MQHKRRRDCNRGRIEGRALSVGLVALNAVPEAIRCTTRFGAQGLSAAGIETRNYGVALHCRLQHGCVHRRHGVVRKQRCRENDKQITYSAGSHFSDIPTYTACLRNDNTSFRIITILPRIRLCPLIQIKRSGNAPIATSGGPRSACRTGGAHPPRRRTLPPARGRTPYSGGDSLIASMNRRTSRLSGVASDVTLHARNARRHSANHSPTIAVDPKAAQCTSLI